MAANWHSVQASLNNILDGESGAELGFPICMDQNLNHNLRHVVQDYRQEVHEVVQWVYRTYRSRRSARPFTSTGSTRVGNPLSLRPFLPVL